MNHHQPRPLNTRSTSTHPERLNALLSKREVLALTGWSNSTLYNRIAANDFPRQIRTGPRTADWVQSEVHAYIEGKVAQRDRSAAMSARTCTTTK